MLIGAYIFGAATVLQLHAQAAQFGVPSQLLSAVPYLATILALLLLSLRHGRAIGSPGSWACLSCLTDSKAMLMLIRLNVAASLGPARNMRGSSKPEGSEHVFTDHHWRIGRGRGPGSGSAAQPRSAESSKSASSMSARWATTAGATSTSQGRQAIEKALPRQGRDHLSSRACRRPDSERAIEQLARTGHGLIFTTSFGFMEPTLKVAKKYPNIKFEHATGFKRAPNLSTYAGEVP